MSTHAVGVTNSEKSSRLQIGQKPFTAEPPEVSSTKTCSSVALVRTSSRRPHPAATTVSAICSIARSTSSISRFQVTKKHPLARQDHLAHLGHALDQRFGRLGLMHRHPYPERATQLAKVVDRAFCDQLAFRDDQGAIARRLDLGENVAREKHRMFAPELANERAHLANLVGIEPGGGLVEDQDGGARREHRRDQRAAGTLWRGAR